MELKDILLGSAVALTNVSFKNKHNYNEEESIKISTQDYLTGFTIDKEEHNIKAQYKRHLFSENQLINIEIEFEFTAIIKDDYNLDINQNDIKLISSIEQNKDVFLLFAPAEASSIISNLFKAANYPPLITQPSFID